MLTKVVIHNFRSCVDVTLDDLGPTVVLIGRNGVGKTNILRAIQWAAERALSTNSNGLHPSSGASVTLEFRVEDRSFCYFLGYVLAKGDGTKVGHRELQETIDEVTQPDQRHRLAERLGSDLNISIPLPSGIQHFRMEPTAPCIPFLLANLPLDHETVGQLRIVKNFLSNISYYPIDEQNDPSREVFERTISKSAYTNWLESPVRRHDSVATIFKFIHLNETNEEALAEAFAILGAEGLGLISGIQITDFGKKNEIPPDDNLKDLVLVWFLSYGLNAHQSSFNFYELSLGTRRIIQIIVAMIHDKSSVMLIEHPEDGIHRGLTRKLIDTLKAYTDPGQMIVSSHSELVFDMLDPTEIRIVTLNDRGTTQVQALTPDQVEGSRRYINESGPLSEYLQIHFED